MHFPIPRIFSIFLLEFFKSAQTLIMILDSGWFLQILQLSITLKLKICAKSMAEYVQMNFRICKR